MITVTQKPSQITPLFNPIVFVATSNNTSQDNFRYVVDVYTDGILRNRLIIPGNPTNNSLFVDVAPILEPLVTRDVNTGINDTGVVNCSNSKVAYEVRFGEQYGSSGTIFADLKIETNYYTWNSIFDYEDFVDYSSGDYNCTIASNGQFLTNRPSSGDVYIDDNAWLYWMEFVNGTGTGDARIITYNSAGTVLKNVLVNNVTASGMVIQRIPAGPSNINEISNANLSGGVQPLIGATTAKYSIHVVDSAGSPTQVSDIYYFTIASGCSNYDKINIVFLNKLGGYDSFAFIQSSKSQTNIERKEYKTSFGSFSSATSFTYSKSDRGITNYYTKLRDSYSVESDWITEEQSIWLEELITSPDVYIDNGTELIPIVVLNGTYERKRTVNEKLFNLRLEYKYSYERYRQRR